MMEEYRKRGSIVRWENGCVIAVAENGLAVEDGERFECRPDEGERMPLLESSRVEDDARTIHEVVSGSANIERLVITEGVAEHSFGTVRWRDETRRIHLALASGRLRALLDMESLDRSLISGVANALLRCEPSERPSPPRLRLAPNVTAALLPLLVGIAPPNTSLIQSGGGIDGKGAAVEEMRIDTAPWPNWYRPSYRARPSRMPFNLRLESEVTAIDRERPIAVALLAPASGLELRLLVRDGERAYPVTSRVTRIDAVSEERTWYPYGAGSFGAEMML